MNADQTQFLDEPTRHSAADETNLFAAAQPNATATTSDQPTPAPARRTDSPTREFSQAEVEQIRSGLTPIEPIELVTATDLPAADAASLETHPFAAAASQPIPMRRGLPKRALLAAGLVGAGLLALVVQHSLYPKLDAISPEPVEAAVSSEAVATEAVELVEGLAETATAAVAPALSERTERAISPIQIDDLGEAREALETAESVAAEVVAPLVAATSGEAAGGSGADVGDLAQSAADGVLDGLLPAVSDAPSGEPTVLAEETVAEAPAESEAGVVDPDQAAPVESEPLASDPAEPAESSADEQALAAAVAPELSETAAPESSAALAALPATAPPQVRRVVQRIFVETEEVEEAEEAEEAED